MKVITATFYNRPDATKEMLDRLKACIGIDQYTLICYCEPEFPEVVSLIEQYPYDKIVVINESLLGCWQNKISAIKHGFSLSDYVIHLEDDVMLCPDALLFFEFAEKYGNVDNTFSATALSFDESNQEEYLGAVKLKDKYESHGFALWRKSWDLLTEKGWDGSDKFIKDNITGKHVYPVISRCIHRGRYSGSYSHPDMIHTLRANGQEPFAFAGLKYPKSMQFVDNPEWYEKQIQKQAKSCNNSDLKLALEHQIRVAKLKDFRRQRVVNQKDEEWIKLDDAHVKSKNLKEYEIYDITCLSEKFKIPVPFYELKEPVKIESSKEILVKIKKQKKVLKKQCDVITCLTPSYERYAGACLESILSSNFVKPYIHCSLSGVSKSSQIYKEFKRYINFYQVENKSISLSLNHYELKMKTYPFWMTENIAVMDIDDIMLPDRLWYSVHTLESGYDACCGRIQPFVSYKEKTERPSHREFWYSPDEKYFYHSTTMIKKSYLEELKGWLSLPCSSDKQFFWRLDPKRIHMSEEYFNLYRIHGESLSSRDTTKPSSKIREEVERSIVLNQNHPGDLFNVQGDIEKC